MKTKTGKTTQSRPTYESAIHSVTKRIIGNLGQKAAKQAWVTPSLREQPRTNREELINVGLCVVCQAEPLVTPSRPLGKRCVQAFNIADNIAMKFHVGGAN